MTLERIDPAELAIALKVLGQVPQLHPDHDDVRTVKRAASYMYKLIKKQRRAEIREAVSRTTSASSRAPRPGRRYASTTRPRASRWSPLPWVRTPAS